MWDNYDDCETQEDERLIIWKCDKCGDERQDYPGYNEGGQCHCGGVYIEAGYVC